MSTNGTHQELVTLTIDGQQVQVPKGTNLIEAAKLAGIEIPYYCYHPHLSIAGNCRMCQVQVKGQPKLTIGCNTSVQEGMEVLTQRSSTEVKDAQAATLEFILINHPLDCTVCDQAGHCKLQDYHYEYNARPSRFLENKVQKVKAEPLGPTVMLDGERCIMCTRCIRFCDEVTETSELGMLNRGDRSVISINPGRVLDNPLSGTVVDLCPVGALTHSTWRFNTRIWFTQQTDSVCPGCSTGCNARVAVRDREVVQVKGRLNSAVNKEWMCDEGRYGFHRFLPVVRCTEPLFEGKAIAWESALSRASAVLSNSDTLVFVSPDLLLDEYLVLKKFLDDVVKRYQVVLSYRERPLTPVEAKLISPDYAANFRGAEFSGLVSGSLERNYDEALSRLRSGEVKKVLLVGDRAILSQDADSELLQTLGSVPESVGLLSDGASPLVSHTRIVLPSRTILEKSGLLINRKFRLQYSDRVIEFPVGTEPAWRIFGKLAAVGGKRLVDATSDRELTLQVLASRAEFSGLKLAMIKAGGVQLQSPTTTDPSSFTIAHASA